MKQVSEEEQVGATQELFPTITEDVPSDITTEADTSAPLPLPTTTAAPSTVDGGVTARRMSKGSTIKVKSSRRASFQLSNTVKNLARESGVGHLLGSVNESGEKKVGMRDQINQLKEEIEMKGILVPLLLCC